MIDPMRSGRPAIPRLVSDPSLAHILTYWFVAIATMDQQRSVNLQWRLVVNGMVALEASDHLMFPSFIQDAAAARHPISALRAQRRSPGTYPSRNQRRSHLGMAEVVSSILTGSTISGISQIVRQPPFGGCRVRIT